MARGKKPERGEIVRGAKDRRRSADTGQSPSTDVAHVICQRERLALAECVQSPD